jgi:two-component sensor histidine kinase
MVENLKRLYASGGRIRIRLDSDGARLDVQTAVPLGMILNEIVTNAMKHAFNGRESGEVSIALRRSPDGALALSVRDDGVGLPAHVDMENPASFGLELVTLLAQQIGAWVSVSTGSGTCFSVQVPPPKPDPRLPAAAETEPAAG